jgi:hypothetical protein
VATKTKPPVLMTPAAENSDRGRDRANLDGVAVYSGRQLLGTTFDIGCRCAAELADGVDLGVFPSREAACAAILAATATARARA